MALIPLVGLGAPSQKTSLLGGVVLILINPRPSPRLADVGLFVRPKSQQPVRWSCPNPYKTKIIPTSSRCGTICSTQIPTLSSLYVACKIIKSETMDSMRLWCGLQLDALCSLQLATLDAWCASICSIMFQQLNGHVPRGFYPLKLNNS